ncbi:neuraminidase-like domain-containing protein [Psychromonas sp. MB-3u-54]|uniref:Tc toxin subunit A-related protein n=1 Tax=Psychromonas sp. MB-3u-54 TaxID=2058319 RepID=UPI0018E307B4|nr:neuraminidase-like domain-containing protein [Psychromonas sp. MB-3u-54]
MTDKSNKTPLTIHQRINIDNIASQPYRASNQDGLRDELMKNPTYRELFVQAEAAGAVDHDSSILSPAAYFVDLMRLIEKRITNGTLNDQDDWGKLDDLKLNKRRPDLLEIELDAKNTTTEVPYLEIVNEVMRKRLEADSGQAALQQLATSIYPLNLPYNAPLEQIRLYLKHFKTDLATIYELFGADAIHVDCEQLGLSVKEYSFITTPLTTDEALSKAYGLAPGNSWRLTRADRFLAQAELTTEQLAYLQIYVSGRLFALGHVLAISDDNGTTWQQIGEGQFEVVSQILAHANRLFVCDYNGVFVSDDNGASWQQTGLDQVEIKELVSSGGYLFARTDDALFISDDFGICWRKIFIEKNMEPRIVVSKSRFVVWSASQLFVSDDQGISWLRTGQEEFDRLIAIDEVVAFYGHLIARTGKGIFISHDIGTTWLPKLMLDNRIVQLLIVGDRLIANTAGLGDYSSGNTAGRFISDDYGTTWQQKGGDENGGRIPANILVSANLLFACNYGIGLYVSEDFGSSWRQTGKETFNQHFVKSVIAHGSRFFAYTKYALYVSEDGAATWQKIWQQTSKIKVLISCANRLIAHTDSGFFVSDDNGTAWQKIDKTQFDDSWLCWQVTLGGELTLPVLDYLNRFIRLANYLGWSCEDLDTALQSIAAGLGGKEDAEDTSPPNLINIKSLCKLAQLKKFSDKYKLSVDVVCSFVHDMNTNPGFAALNHPEPKSLFDRVFNTPPFYQVEGAEGGTYHSKGAGYLKSNTEGLVWNPKVQDPKNQGIRSSLLAALNVGNDDLQSIVEHIYSKNLFTEQANTGGIDAAPIALDLHTLTRLYRFSKMAKALGMRVQEYLLLLKCITGEGRLRLATPEVSSVDNLRTVEHWADWLKDAQLSPSQLEYLMTGEMTHEARRSVDPGWSEGSLKQLTSGLHATLKPRRVDKQTFVLGTISSEKSAAAAIALREAGLIVGAGWVQCPVVEAGEEPGKITQINQAQVRDALESFIVRKSLRKVTSGEAAQGSVTALAIAGDQQVIFAATARTVTSIPGGSDNWVGTVLEDTPADIRALAVTPDCKTLLAATQKRLYRYLSLEMRWEDLKVEGFDGAYLTSLAVTADGNTLCVGTDIQGLYCSTDGGNKWIKVIVQQLQPLTDEKVTAIAVSPDDQSLFAAIQVIHEGAVNPVVSSDIFRSADGGKTWNAMDIAVHKDETIDSLIINYRGEVRFASKAKGVFTDTQWSSLLSQGAESTNVTAMVADTDGESVIFTDSNGELFRCFGTGIANLEALIDSLRSDEDAVNVIIETLNRELDFQVQSTIQQLAATFNQDWHLVATAVDYLNHKERSAARFLTIEGLQDAALLLYLAKALKLTSGCLDAVLKFPSPLGLDERNTEKSYLDSSHSNIRINLDKIRSVHAFAGLVDTFQQQGSKGKKTAPLLTELAQCWSFDELPDADKKKLETLSAWPASQISALHGHLSVISAKDSVIGLLSTMKQSFDLAAKLGVDVQMLIQLCTLHAAQTNFSQISTVAHSLLGVVKSKYSDDDWGKTFGPIRDHLNERERDALVGLLMHQLSQNETVAKYFYGMDSLKDLSDYLLIDVEMSGVAKVSKVKQGLNTLQRYIQRSHMGLEADGQVTCPVGDKEWAWRSHYRLWEANRKVFLYPENYLDPGLRKIKTPLFKELEDELLQGEITDEAVTQAYINYFDKLDELANLKIVDTCAGRVTHPVATNAEETIFVIGKTKNNPPVYYYRSAVYDGKGEIGMWRPWQKIALSISVDTVTCLYANHSLYLFWVETKTISDREFITDKKMTTTTATVKFAYHNVSGKWLPPQVLSAKVKLEDIPHRYSIPGGGTVKIYQKKTKLDLSSFNTGASTGWGKNRYLEQYWQDRDWESVGQDSGRSKSDLNWEAAWALDAKEIPTNWLSQKSSSESKWLKPYRHEDDGRYTFQRKFDVSTIAVGHDVSDLSISMRLAVNGGVDDIRWNGKSIKSIFLPTRGGPTDQIAVNELVLAKLKVIDQKALKEAGTCFQKQSNLLEILVSNEDDLVSLRVEFEGEIIKPCKLSAEGTMDTHREKVLKELSEDRTAASVSIIRQSLVQGGVTNLFELDSQKKLNFDGPCSIYYRELFFHIPFLIADTLNRNQHFEDAQKWYHYIFNPMPQKGLNKKPDGKDDPTPFWRYLPFKHHTLEKLQDIEKNNPGEFKIYTDDPFDPHAIAGLRLGAYEKAIVMKYIDNLLDWGDQLFAQDSWESIVQAMLLYVLAQDLLGKKQKQTRPSHSPKPSKRYDQFDTAIDFTDPFHVKDTEYFPVSPNTNFAGYWDRAEDRLFKIRHCMNIKGVVRQLSLFQPPIDPRQLIRAMAAGQNLTSVAGQMSALVPHYRFTTMIQQAKSVTSTLIQLGSALLSALEKKDVEQLSLLRSSHEKAILSLTTRVKEKQIDDAGKNIDSLNASLEGANDRKKYYTDKGLITEETSSLNLMIAALSFQTALPVLEALTIPAWLAPNVFGLADGGSNWGRAAQVAPRVSESTAVILNQGSQLAATKAQNFRRKEEWGLQATLAGNDVEQIQAQIAGATVRQEIAQLDLDMHQKSIVQSGEMEDLLRTKFTNRDLYQWMVGRISSVYFQTYKIAFELAQAAEKAYQYERNTREAMITFGYWDSLKKGLLAGEGLMLGLNQLEKAYMEDNERTLEIEKTISLKQMDPQAWLNLRSGGKCIFDLTEALFDRDFPGHYCRKIASIAISIPAIVGPYQNVQATLTQQNSYVVLTDNIDTIKYLLPDDSTSKITPSDDQLRSDPRVKQQIALSKGINDSGMFELNFHDQRYLPFEGTGAVSGWELRMPKAANSIDFNSISDVIIHLRYTALDGGASLRQQVVALPAIKQDGGFRLISLRQQFSEEWKGFISGKDKQLSFAINAHMFPLNLDAKTINLRDLSARVLVNGEDGSGAVLSKDANVNVQKNKEEDMKGGMAKKSDPTLGEYYIATKAVGNLDNLVDICVIVPYEGMLNWDSD